MSFEMLKKFNPALQQQIKDQQLADADAKIEKTGKTGTHLGFAYEELKMTSSDGNGTLWIGTDESFNIFKLFMDMGGMGGPSPFSVAQFDMMDGLILKGDFIDDQSGSQTNMKLIESVSTTETINTASYTLMDMSAMMGK